MLGIRNEKFEIGIAGSRNCHCEGASRPWQSREGTADLERLSLKWYVPIASVAAVTAQPLAALPPYGCGVPLAGSERHADWQVIGWHRRPCRLPDLSLRGGRRPTWRPEREARGSALGVQSREGTADLERLSLKWYVPIASVAALTAQPLAALPPYGCGVPLAGSDRPVRDYSTAGGHWCTTALPDVSLRGRFAPVAISGRQLRFRRRLSCDLVGYCEIATSLRSSQ